MPPADMSPPKPAATVFHSAWRFTVASLGVFGLWAFGGRWFYQNLGEKGFYLVCAVAFVGLCGLLLHPLTNKRTTLRQFYVAFAVSFLTYAAVWSAAWFLLRGKTGEWVGSIAGPVAFAILLLGLTNTHSAGFPLLLAIVALHSLGYFAGDSLYAWAKSPSAAETLTTFSKAERHKLGQMLWGLTYGLGLGSAIGLVLYQIAAESPKEEPLATN